MLTEGNRVFCPPFSPHHPTFVVGEDRRRHLLPEPAATAHKLPTRFWRRAGEKQTTATTTIVAAAKPAIVIGGSRRKRGRRARSSWLRIYRADNGKKRETVPTCVHTSASSVYDATTFPPPCFANSTGFARAHAAAYYYTGGFLLLAGARARAWRRRRELLAVRFRRSRCVGTCVPVYNLSHGEDISSRMFARVLASVPRLSRDS